MLFILFLIITQMVQTGKNFFDEFDRYYHNVDRNNGNNFTRFNYS